MKKNYLEKKAQRKKILWASIFTPITVMGLYFFLIKITLGFVTPEDEFYTIMSLITWGILLFLYFIFFNFLMIYLDISLKIKRKKPEWLLSEIKELEGLFDKKYSEFSKKEREFCKTKNECCPICGNTEGNVQKIREVAGKISGDFSLGFGVVNGEVHTSEVNHCSKCGNEWKKSQMSSDIWQKSIDSMFKDMLSFLSGEKMTGMKDPLKSFSAKALKLFLKQNGHRSFASEDLSKLSTREFRKYTGR